MADPSTRGKLLRLSMPLIAAWTLAWILGIASIAWIAVKLRAELRDADLDTELALYATAVYGLTWFDETGAFHGELLQREPDLVTAPVDIWVVAPGAPPVAHLVPSQPRFAIEDFDRLTATVIGRSQEVYRDGFDADGTAYRLHAIPTFGEATDDEPIAMVVVVGDPEPGRTAHRAFVSTIALATLVLGLAGLLVGIGLTRWSLRPAIDSLRQRERFLAAAAHEFRTPLAALRSVCDSAMQGDEDPQQALGRMSILLQAASHTVEDLLLFARLDAGTELARQKVRLDLLAETVLPDDGRIRLEAEPTIVHADPRLLTVAIRNVVENARTHGGPTDRDITVRVQGAAVVVEDRGPGFAATLLGSGERDISIAPSKRGTGLGLAITYLVTRLHGGSLLLENRSAGGARIALRLAPSMPTNS